MTRAPSFESPLAHARLDGVRRQLHAALDGDLAHVWFVGGVVRDALLQRPLLDIDIAVTARPDDIARRIAREVGGTAFPLGDGHGCWRVTIDPGATSQGDVEFEQIDVCELRGATIEDDLRARDFTLNALASSAGDPLGAVIDPTGGRDDLNELRIRMTSEQALDDDPLRMLRAARCAHVLDGHIDDATAAAIRSRAPRVVEPAGERTSDELGKLLLHPEARRGWRLIEQLGLDAPLLPELAACKGLEQSEFHQFDVYAHTLAALDNADDIAREPAFWLGACDGAPQQLPASVRLAVLYAALLHDIGKPPTKGVRADGRVSYAGHADAGADMVTDIAERLRWSSALRDSVRHLVRTHLVLGYALHGTMDARERWRVRRELDPHAAAAIVLSCADRFATNGRADRRSWVRAHLGFARQLWADHWRDAAAGVPAPLLDGRAIADAAGITPGPRLGELVRLLAREQHVGAVTTIEQATAFVRAAARDHESGTSESTVQQP